MSAIVDLGIPDFHIGTTHESLWRHNILVIATDPRVATHPMWTLTTGCHIVARSVNNLIPKPISFRRSAAPRDRGHRVNAND